MPWIRPDMEREISGAGQAQLEPPHRFILVSDGALGELFVKCLCSWQTIHYLRSPEESTVSAVARLLEKDIHTHNASPGGDLGGG